ncbi:hypothetical protein HYV88_00930 [Candidatus Woesearchaeota archaeon]|nr:hypothetical protein [Candidatus Woesearchaeota archaeon]
MKRHHLKAKFNLEDDSYIDETDIYDQRYTEELLENDEISGEEEAFMNGYNE